MVKAHVDVQRIHSAKESARIQGHTHQLMQKKEIGPVLNIAIATVIDVPGIEVQVPSLSSPGCSVWILISRGHERFVNEIHRHNSDIVNYSSSLRTKEDNLNDVCSRPAVVNHGQGSQDSNNVKTKVEPSSMHRETVASHDTGSPGLLKKQQRREQHVNTSENKVHLHKERDPRRGHNLDYNSWMPEMRKGIPLKLTSPSVPQI